MAQPPGNLRPLPTTTRLRTIPIPPAARAFGTITRPASRPATLPPTNSTAASLTGGALRTATLRWKKWSSRAKRFLTPARGRPPSSMAAPSSPMHGRMARCRPTRTITKSAPIPRAWTSRWWDSTRRLTAPSGPCGSPRSTTTLWWRRRQTST